MYIIWVWKWNNP